MESSEKLLPSHSNSSEEEEKSSSSTGKSKENGLCYRIWKGLWHILLCKGDLSEDALERKPVSQKEMFRFASKKNVISIAMGAVLSALSGVFMPFICVLEGFMVNAMLKSEQPIGDDAIFENIKFYVILMLVQGLCSAITTAAQAYLLQKGCSDMVCRIRREFLAAVVRQDPEFFAKNNSGTITAQLNSNIQRIEDGLGDKLGLLIRGFSMFITSVITCFFVDWRLTLLSFFMGPLAAWTYAIMGKVTTKYTERMMKTSSEAATIVEEAVMNVKTVAACNAQNHMVEKYKEMFRSYLPDAQKMYFWMGFFEGLTLFEIYVMMGVVQWLGVEWYYSGYIKNPGSVYLVSTTMSMTVYNLGTLGPHMMALLKARVAAAVIYETIDREPAIDPHSEEGITLDDPKGDIELRDVTFRYPGRETLVLKGISWMAEQGESVALVGQSGSGKSTSIGLLTRLHDVETGEITVDGIPIKEINVRSLRKIIGIVEQEPCLFNGTVMDNIILGREGVTKEDAQKAAVMAKAHDFIELLQDGYDTILGVGGVSLSGGQKQRIAIARAVVTDPKILLLDEATSALDTESEKIVQAALNRAAEGRTTVIVAHRLSTLKDVDRIYVMEKGVVVEEGTHDGLIEEGGLYAGLAKAQEIQTNADESNRGKNMEIYSRETVNSPLEPKENEGEKKKETEEEISYGNSSGLWKIFSNMKGSYRMFLVVFIISLIRGLEMPLAGFAMSFGFNALNPKHRDDFRFWAIFTMAFFVGIAVGSLVTQILQHVFSGRLAEQVVDRLRIRAFRSLLHRPIARFDESHSSPAACVSKFTQHPSSCLAALDYRGTTMFVNQLGIVLGLLCAFFYSWQIGLYATGTCTLLLLFLIVNTVFANRARAKKAIKDRSSEYAVEIVEQTRTIQLLTVEEHFLRRYRQQQSKAICFDRTIIVIEAVNFALAQSFVSFADVGVYYLAGWLIHGGVQPVGDIFFAIMCTVMANWSVLYSAPFTTEVIRAGSAAHQLFTLIDNEDEIMDSIHGGLKPEIKGCVSLKEVDFSYPVRPKTRVSKEMSIEANAGENIALVGPSGSGKSTIINLLERFYAATGGEVLIDETDVRKVNLHHLRSHVALVSQEPVLFKGTILENITMGAEEVSMEEVVTACRTANALQFIQIFPMGFETDVGEHGKALSGGQKQRIAIARALVRNPRVILLDEATSALDTESEKVVQRALNDASIGRTSITIAHRLSSVQHCDRIYVIEKGRVVESGRHKSLMLLNGRYKRLVDAQKLNAL